jgi:hypothetical protein
MEALSSVLSKIITYIVQPAMLLLFAAGFTVFMFGLLQFMWNLRSGEVSTQGKDHMLWGIIGMFIMVSVYGIIQIIDNTFGFGALSGTGPSTDVSRASNITAPGAFK